MYTENDFRLYHHGIRGQKWGIQNGPPYPLDSAISTGARLKSAARAAAGKIKEHHAKQAEIKAAKKQRRAEEAAAKKEAAKRKEIDDAVKSGDIKRINKHQNEMSIQQFNEAVQRAELNKRLNNTETSAFDKAVRIAQNVANLSNSASNIYNNLSSISKKIDEADEAREKKAKEEKEQAWIRNTSSEKFVKNASKLSTNALKERSSRETYLKNITSSIPPKPTETTETTETKPTNNHRDNNYKRNENNSFWSGSYRRVKKEETPTYAQIVNDIMKSDEYRRLSARLP